ncbi:MAG: ABC transporter permease, partial [Myxococcota bacterium]
MSRLRQTFDIARWEFMRFFKPRDVILTIVIMVGVTGAAYGFSYWQKQSEPVIELAVISPADLPLTDPTFAVTHHPAEREAQLRAQVAAKELDGLLIVASSPAQTALVVRKSPAWIDRLNTALTGIAREQRLHQLGIDQTQLAAALAPVAVTVELTAGASDAGHQRGLAAILVGLMLLSLFLSLSYLFMGITGEKQQRATEQLFSITSAQAIIDGKLLGIAAVAVLYTVQLAGLGLVLYEVVSGGAVDWLLA